MFRTIVIAVGLAAYVASPALAAEQLVPLAVLKTDIAKFQGRTIDVSGHLEVLGEVATLGINGSDARTIMVELANLPRDQRQTLTSKCFDGCDVRITGRGGMVLHDRGVIASALHLSDEMASAKAD